MDIVYHPIKELIFSEYNPRKISDKQLKDLSDSIQRFGFVEPVVINTSKERLNIVISGHQRLRVGEKLRIDTIPCIELDLSLEREKELNIRMNKAGGAWDNELLTEFFEKEDLIEWGFEIEEFPQSEGEAHEDDYEIPDEIKTDIVLGDLIEIGEHRLLCGDSTNSEHISRLMGDYLADCVVTDPPYNTGMTPNPKNVKARLSHMFNDSFSDVEWDDLLSATFSNISIFTKSECAIYVFIDWRRAADIKRHLETIADIKNIIVWDKEVHGLGSDYKSTYENIVVGKKGKPQINNRYGLDYQDIWRVQRNMGRNKEHATTKPVELIGKPIKHASKGDDIILDLFGGSGTTMVACHQLGRKCYMQELVPQYCQITINRMKKLDTKIEIKVLHNATQEKSIA